MGTSFFGGNPAYEHYSTSTPMYLYQNKEKREGRESEKDSRVRRRAAHDKIKAAGFQTKYFQFKTVDKKGDEKAKKDCEAYAKLIFEKTGVEVEVFRGCFL